MGVLSCICQQFWSANTVVDLVVFCRHGEGYSLCLITFILIYYFTMAAAIWFVSMTYCWYRSFKMLCTKEIKAQRNLKTYSVRFHIAAWVTPLLLTLIVIATSGVKLPWLIL